MDFTVFFRELHGPEKTPFHWQSELAARVLDSGWPKRPLDLPTASGKTAVLDMAVFALAVQAGRNDSPRTAALRTFFVIDRRVVVDQAARRANGIAEKLKEALKAPEKLPTLHEAAKRLLSFGGYAPLHVAVLRGGIYREPAWYVSPNQPLICLSTVDQVGSRLLFRGYGVGEFMRPIHAGLIGCDSLVFVDEAHLSAPFLETLGAVQSYVGDESGKKWAEQPLQMPFKVVELSATQPATAKSFEEEKPFSLPDADLDPERSPVLAPRLLASKHAFLEAPATFENAAAEKATAFLADASVHVIGVIVNRVRSARQIYDQLSKQFSAEDQADVILLTGRSRSYDRDKLLAENGPYLRFLSAERNRDVLPPRKLIVVATQTIEVGADLDFDALITEAASLDAVRQRFGRLDRMGKRKISSAWILLRKLENPDGTPMKDDPIYGTPLAETWAWLNRQVQPPKKKGKKAKSQNQTPETPAYVDFGVVALQERLKTIDDLSPYLMPREKAPILLPAYLDTLAQTSPTPFPEPEISLLLHGPDTATADVQIVWRADLLPGQEPLWPEIVALQPPHVSEAISVPIFAAKQWLFGLDSGEAVTDLEGVTVKPDARSQGKAEGRPVCRWRGREGTNSVSAKDILPGDTLVVPSIYGGADSFGWNPGSKDAVSDIGDFVERQRKLGLRIDAQGLSRTFSADTARFFQEFKTAVIEEDDSAANAAFRGFFRSLAVDESATAELRELAKKISQEISRPDASGPRWRRYPRQSESGFFLTTILPKPQVPIPDDEIPGEDDEASRQDRPITLLKHQLGVEKTARTFATACGLPSALACALAIAGRYHDLGKADPRFQVLLHGGDKIGAFLALKNKAPLAKSNLFPEDRQTYERARQRAGWPKGSRHELLSAGLLKQFPALLNEMPGTRELPPFDHELVLHLVSVHHGRGRPFVPVIDDPVEQPIPIIELSVVGSNRHELEKLESGWTDQFWTLVRRYGYWGLAYLEAIIRIADHQQSRKEQA